MMFGMHGAKILVVVLANEEPTPSLPSSDETLLEDISIYNWELFCSSAIEHFLFLKLYILIHTYTYLIRNYEHEAPPNLCGSSTSAHYLQGR